MQEDGSQRFLYLNIWPKSCSMNELIESFFVSDIYYEQPIFLMVCTVCVPDTRWHSQNTLCFIAPIAVPFSDLRKKKKTYLMSWPGYVNLTEMFQTAVTCQCGKIWTIIMLPPGTESVNTGTPEEICQSCIMSMIKLYADVIMSKISVY